MNRTFSRTKTKPIINKTEPNFFSHHYVTMSKFVKVIILIGRRGCFHECTLYVHTYFPVLFLHKIYYNIIFILSYNNIKTIDCLRIFFDELKSVSYQYKK